MYGRFMDAFTKKWEYEGNTHAHDKSIIENV